MYKKAVSEAVRQLRDKGSCRKLKAFDTTKIQQKSFFKWFPHLLPAS